MKRFLAVVLTAVVVLGSTLAFAEDVYVTKNGKKYHKAECLLIKNKNAKPVNLEDAQKKGLNPCGRCFGNPNSAKNDQPSANAVNETASK